MNDIAETVPNATPEETPDKQVIKGSTAADIFKELETSDEAITEPHVVKDREFHIKHFSSMDILKIESMSVRDSGGEMAQTLEVAYRNRVLYNIVLGVVKSATDTTPLFTHKQALELMNNPKAAELVDNLYAAVQRVNFSKNS